MTLLSDEIISNSVKPYYALILFGSHSRGDFSNSSDIDVLQISKNINSSYTYSIGKINYTVYSLSQILSMAEKSSLFILHIIKEGSVIDDPNNIFLKIKDSFHYLKNYSLYRIEINLASKFLADSEDSYNRDKKGNFRFLIYLFRSLLYSLLYDMKQLTFSIDNACRIFQDPSLVVIKQYRNFKDGPAYLEFKEIKRNFRQYLQIDEPELDKHKLIKVLKSSESEMFFVITHFLNDAKQEFYL